MSVKRIILRFEGLPYLRVSVYSPSSLLEASRTRKVPSGVSFIFSFTSSLQTHTGNVVKLQPQNNIYLKVTISSKATCYTYRMLY